MSNVPTPPAPLDAETSPDTPQRDARSPVVGATPTKLARFLKLLDAEFKQKTDGEGV